MRLRHLLPVLLLLLPAAAEANTCASYPFTLTNNTLADANQVMANFNNIMDCANILLAPIGSPTFTGIPRAPTAAPGTNTNQIATTAFVQSPLTITPTGVNPWCDVTGHGALGDGVTNNFTAFNACRDIIAANFAQSGRIWVPAGHFCIWDPGAGTVALDLTSISGTLEGVSFGPNIQGSSVIDVCGHNQTVVKINSYGVGLRNLWINGMNSPSASHPALWVGPIAIAYEIYRVYAYYGNPPIEIDGDDGLIIGLASTNSYGASNCTVRGPANFYYDLTCDQNSLYATTFTQITQTPTAAFTAKLDNGSGGSGNVLDVSAVASTSLFIPLVPGLIIAGPGVTPGTTITGYVTGSGGTGKYTTSNNATITSPIAMTGAPGARQATTVYPANSMVEVGGHRLSTQAGGTTGVASPAVPPYYTGSVDGTVTWSYYSSAGNVTGLLFDTNLAGNVNESTIYKVDVSGTPYNRGLALLNNFAGNPPNYLRIEGAIFGGTACGICLTEGLRLDVGGGSEIGAYKDAGGSAILIGPTYTGLSSIHDGLISGGFYAYQDLGSPGKNRFVNNMVAAVDTGVLLGNVDRTVIANNYIEATTFCIKLTGGTYDYDVVMGNVCAGVANQFDVTTGAHNTIGPGNQ